MQMVVKQIKRNEADLWESYIDRHPHATLYHRFSWKTIIEKTYGHKTYYLAAFNSTDNPVIVGVLPLIHIKHFIFGNSLISIPFFDMAGILADNEEIEQTLCLNALSLGRSLNVKNLELRHSKVLPGLEGIKQNRSTAYTLKSHKTRMLLELPASSETLMTSFKSKLRSQIKKPIKEGLQVKIGKKELLDDFYKVFLINMRDLGSPIHSKQLIDNVLMELYHKTWIFIVYNGRVPYAASIVSGYKDTLENPWASSLKQFSRLSPNMLLYWAMLKYACDNGYKYFDFGRSTPGEGTYKFKTQWGARPEQLYWHYYSFTGKPVPDDTQDTSKFNSAIKYWQKMPVSLTEIFGPKLRKYIGL